MSDHLPTNPPQARAARQPHTFVVRMWWEADEGNAGGEWRGSIEHVASHQKRYFRDMRFPETFVAEILTANEIPLARSADSGMRQADADESPPPVSDSKSVSQLD